MSVDSSWLGQIEREWARLRHCDAALDVDGNAPELCERMCTVDDEDFEEYSCWLSGPASGVFPLGAAQ